MFILYFSLSTYIYIHTCVYIYMCVYLCVCGFSLGVYGLGLQLVSSKRHSIEKEQLVASRPIHRIVGQRTQYVLIKEDTLNHNKKAPII